MAKDKTWKVGLIGAGGIVQWSHYPNFGRAIDSTEVVAVSDVNEKRVSEFARSRGIPSFYADYREMLAGEDLDIVVVGTPNVFHKPMSIDALNSGAHVLCEKPVALTLADAQEMFGVAERNGKVLTVGTHYRWGDSMKAVRRSVDDGYFGDIYMIRTAYTRRAGIPGYGSWFTRQELSGGGCGLDIGVHALDKALFLMDYSQPATVSGVTYDRLGKQGVGLGGWGMDRQAASKGGEFSVEDLAYGLVRFASGASIILQASWAMHLPGEQVMEVYGTQGGAVVHPDKLQLFQDMNGAPVTVDVELPAQEANSALDQTRDLVRYLEGDRDALLVTREEVLVGIAILEGLYKSASTGQEVQL